jgi:hypothetical protein
MLPVSHKMKLILCSWLFADTAGGFIVLLKGFVDGNFQQKITYNFRPNNIHDNISQF